MKGKAITSKTLDSTSRSLHRHLGHSEKKMLKKVIGNCRLWPQFKALLFYSSNFSAQGLVPSTHYCGRPLIPQWLFPFEEELSLLSKISRTIGNGLVKAIVFSSWSSIFSAQKKFSPKTDVYSEEARPHHNVPFQRSCEKKEERERKEKFRPKK